MAEPLASRTGQRPEFAIALAQPLWIETGVPRPDHDGHIEGYAVAVGWDRPQRSTAYLVTDDELPAPVWISEADITGSSIRHPR